MLPCGIFNRTYKKDMAIVRTKEHWGLLIGFMVLLYAVPQFMGGHVITLMNMICITIIAVQGLNILTGYAGQISVGHSAFVAVGAYSSGLLVNELGLSFWAALPCAGLSAGLVGLVFGAPSLRLRGFYLVMTTLAAQFLILYVFTHSGSLTGGFTGMPVPSPSIGSFCFDTDVKYAYIIITFSILMTFIAKSLVRGKIGRAFIAIRDNDKAAQAMGVSLFRYKLLAFFIASFFAGVAGSIFGHYMTVVHPEQFTLTDSIWYLGMIIVGGMGTITGAIMGVVMIKLLDEAVIVASPFFSSLFPQVGAQSMAALGLMAFGITIMIFLLFEPRGLQHRWEIFKSYYRMWPFSY